MPLKKKKKKKYGSLSSVNDRFNNRFGVLTVTLFSGPGYIYPSPFTPLLSAVHTYVYIEVWLWSWIALVAFPLSYLSIDYLLTLVLLSLLNYPGLMGQSDSNRLIIIKQFVVSLMGTACIVSQ